MFKKRTGPRPRQRERSLEVQAIETGSSELEEGDEEAVSLADLLELRKLKKTKQGIDSVKLTKGDTKVKRKRPTEEQGGLRKGAVVDDDEDEEKNAKARRAVRANNFTQQTNTLDVDKHMMAYIEENLKIRSQPKEEAPQKPVDPEDALFNIPDKLKLNKSQTVPEEGNVTNSLTMLTAIPEVDLGMDARLKNIEETEKAKRSKTEQKNPRLVAEGEEHLAASRYYQPNLKGKSDADILRDAKLEARGLPPQEHRHRQDKVQMATDEAVMERFKKRMRN